MKALIIYMSVHHKNTEKIAMEMAEVLDADLMKAYEANEKDISRYDLIGFGSGIYFFKHHRKLLEFAEKLVAKKKNAFIFSTYGGGSPKIYHKLLRKKLAKRGFRIIGEFSCKGYDTFGPLKFIGGINKGKPDEKDLKRAREFAKTLINSSHSSKYEKN